MKLPIVDKKKTPAELFAEAMRAYRKPTRHEFDQMQTGKLASFGIQVINGKITTVDSHLTQKFPK